MCVCGWEWKLGPHTHFYIGLYWGGGVGFLSLKDKLFPKALEESPKQRLQRLEQAERAGEVLVDASSMFSGNYFLALQSHEISPLKGGL